MSKYAAKIHIGWMNMCFEGESPEEIIRKVEEIQDFGCLLSMGREEEGPKGQKELDKLSAFLEKYHDGSLTMEDIRGLDVQLSIGGISCDGIAEGEEEIEKLKN